MVNVLVKGRKKGIVIAVGNLTLMNESYIKDLHQYGEKLNTRATETIVPFLLGKI